MSAFGGDQTGEVVAAGHHGQAARRSGQQRADLLDVPRIVQHHQDPPAREQAAVEPGLAWQVRRNPGNRHPERLQESAYRLAGIQRLPAWIESFQVDVQLPVGKPRGHPVRPVHGQCGLARPGGTRQRRYDHRARPGGAGLVRHREKRVKAGQLRAAAGEGRQRRRQLRRYRHPRRGQRHQGRWPGGIEGRILPEDRRFQVAQLLAGVYTQLLIQTQAQPVVGGQRISLPAAAVQRQHELRVDLLVQRALGRELFQIGHQRQMLSTREPGLGQGQPDLHGEQLQPLRLLLQPGQAGQVRQRLPAPQRQRGLQQPRAPDRIG